MLSKALAVTLLLTLFGEHATAQVEVGNGFAAAGYRNNLFAIGATTYSRIRTSAAFLPNSNSYDRVALSGVRAQRQMGRSRYASPYRFGYTDASLKADSFVMERYTVVRGSGPGICFNDADRPIHSCSCNAGSDSFLGQK